MNLLSSFPRLAFSLVLASIAGSCIAEENVTLLLVAGAIAALSWSITEGPRGRFLPSWIGIALVVVLVVNLLVELLTRGVGWERSLGHFALWLAVLRLYQAKTARDYGLLLLLSLMLMLLGALQSSSLLFGAVLLVYAALGVYTLMVLQLYAGRERYRLRRRHDAPAGQRLIAPTNPVAGPGARRQLRSLAAVVVITGLGLGLLVFVLFPRELGRSMLPRLASVSSENGAGEPVTVDLGSNLSLTESRRMVMTVARPDDAPTSSGVELPLRLRAGTLNIYQRDRRWRSTAGQMRSITTIPSRWTPLGDVDSTDERRRRLQVRPARRSNVVFTNAVPIAIRTAPAESIAFNPITYRTLRDTYTLEPYGLAFDPEPDDELLQTLAGSRSGTTDHSILLTGLIDPEVAELARTVLASAALWPAPDSADRDATRRWRIDAASVLCRHLHEAPFTYTLDVRAIDPPGATRRDPIQRFLLETGAGHCEHFASALAALCWNAGIPVRLVAGYLGYLTNRDGSVRVLECNAHAWTEVLTEPLRWLELDPTPPATRRRWHEIRPTLADRLSWFYQRLEASWDAGIVAYDSDAQERLAQRMDRRWSGRLRRLTASLRLWIDRVNRAFYFGPAGSIWLGVVTVVIVLAALVAMRATRRATTLHRRLGLSHTRGGDRGRMRRQLGFYVDMLETLRRGGAAKPSWMPPAQFAGRLHDRRPAAAELVRQLTELYYAGRYAKRRLTDEELREAASLVRKLAGVL